MKYDFWLAAHAKYELEEETYLPYFFDVVAFNTIENQALKEHIQKYGKEIYTKHAFNNRRNSETK